MPFTHVPTEMCYLLLLVDIVFHFRLQLFLVQPIQHMLGLVVPTFNAFGCQLSTCSSQFLGVFDCILCTLVGESPQLSVTSQGSISSHGGPAALLQEQQETFQTIRGVGVVTVSG